MLPLGLIHPLWNRSILACVLIRIRSAYCYIILSANMARFFRNYEHICKLYPTNVIDGFIQHAINGLDDLLVGFVGSGNGDHIDHFCDYIDV